MSPQPQGNLYHLILGLPEANTSPNHYELLGLDHRTSDSILINNAATDQNRKLLNWQNSDRYSEVKALTFELVQARDVLLKEDLRSAYDASLGDWGLDDETGPWIVEEPRPKAIPLQPLSVRCPECEASFKLRNRALIGERIPCPDCGFRFTVRPEEEPVVEIQERDAIPLADWADSDAELKALENFDDMEDLPESRSTTRTQRRRRADRGEMFSAELDKDDNKDRPSRSRRPARVRRSASKGSGKASAIAGAVLMVLGCLVLSGIVVYRAFSPSTPNLKHELAWLPADCRTLGYYRLGEAARSPFLQDQLTRMPQVRAMVDQFRDRTGMELHDIETVIIGFKDTNPARLNGLGMSGHPQGMQLIAVVRAAKDWDRARLIGTHSQSATHNNHTYHTYPPDPVPAERWAFYLADARTLLFGTEDEVKAAIDTNGNIPDWPDVNFLQPAYPILVANVAESTAVPPALGMSMPLPIATSAPIQGAGLMLSSDAVRQVTFLRFPSTGEAAAFVSSSEEAEETRRRFQQTPAFRTPGGPGTLTFTQHGLTVAVAQGEIGPGAAPMLGQAIAPAVALLARLGEPTAAIRAAGP